MARAHSTWTTEQARDWAAKARAAKALKAASRAAAGNGHARDLPAGQPEDLEPLPFPLLLKSRVRAQVLSLLDGLDSHLARRNLDGSTIDRLASALERLAELERILDGRPGPGNRRPPREDAPSTKPAPVIRPAFTHAGPASAAAMAVRPAPGATPAAGSPTSPPTSEPPSLTERPDF